MIAAIRIQGVPIKARTVQGIPSDIDAIINGVFLAEALSVMIQVASFRMTGRRVFKMAPVHHHFELKGLSEPKIIVRFWIVSIVFGAVALMTLKLR